MTDSKGFIKSSRKNLTKEKAEFATNKKVNTLEYAIKNADVFIGLSKADMVMNNYQPEIEVHPETYEVHADGELLTCDPAAELPMTQRYFLF